MNLAATLRKKWHMSVVMSLVVSLVVFGKHAEAQPGISGPLQPEERQPNEMSRAVSARDYRDAYCAKWTDGCEFCQRSASQAEPACLPEDPGASSCERQPVRCQAALPTIDRVCLRYTDECNVCAAGRCTLMSCPELKRNFQCTVPRRVSYADQKLLELDLRGGWLLTDAGGSSCEISIDGDVELSADCIALGRPVVQIKQMQIANGGVAFASFDGHPLLNFDTADLDALRGTGSAKGYALRRIEVVPVHFRTWEGAWMVFSGGGATCELFLSSRIRRFDQVDIVLPSGIGFTSRCINPDDADELKFTTAHTVENKVQDGRQTEFVALEPVLVPRWINWSYRGLELVFDDVAGASTVFRFDDKNSWVADIPREGNAPLRLRMKRYP